MIGKKDSIWFVVSSSELFEYLKLGLNPYYEGIRQQD